MNNTDELPDELAFISHIVGKRLSQYQNPSWLKSSFSAMKWICLFDSEQFEIDFRIRLDDGLLLTDPHNEELLNTFKYWICAQSHPDLTEGRTLSNNSAYHRVCKILHLIDYLLLNASEFKLAKHGLALITEDDIRHLIYQLAANKEIANAIYRWNDLLTEFLKERGKRITVSELDSIIKECPGIAEIYIEPEDRSLSLSSDELLRARAYLWSHDLYRYAKRQGYRYSPATLQLAEMLYQNTLRGKVKRPIPEELCLLPIDRYQREYPAIPVRTGVGDARTTRNLATYINALRSLGFMAELDLAIPRGALDAVFSKGFIETLDTRPEGRTRTPPQTLVFGALKDAIEFSLEFGVDLIESYLTLLGNASKLDMSVAAYAVQYDITPHLTPRLRTIGVKKWHLSQEIALVNGNPAQAIYPRPTSGEYFQRMRNNEGLLELLRVLLGSIVICVGTLMARRQSELTDLIAGQCLDKTRRYLIFSNRKSGVMGIRETEARPIPPIAVEMIGLLEEFQRRLIIAGSISKYIELFAYPDRYGRGLVFGRRAITDAIDTFCDYFETPLNTKGQRYYIRQHQLRRFFAMLFFWGKSFGGLDTLRWFLGHTDIEHLYHYITDATPGSVLQSVKATYAADLIKQQASESTDLADLVEHHFGTRDFSVLDANELDEYLQDLLEEGVVDIEPQFFETASGQSFRVLVVVKGGRNA